MYKTYTILITLGALALAVLAGQLLANNRALRWEVDGLREDLEHVNTVYLPYGTAGQLDKCLEDLQNGWCAIEYTAPGEVQDVIRYEGGL